MQHNKKIKLLKVLAFPASAAFMMGIGVTAIHADEVEEVPTQEETVILEEPTTSDVIETTTIETVDEEKEEVSVTEEVNDESTSTPVVKAPLKAVKANTTSATLTSEVRYITVEGANMTLNGGSSTPSRITGVQTYQSPNKANDIDLNQMVGQKVSYEDLFSANGLYNIKIDSSVSAAEVHNTETGLTWTCVGFIPDTTKGLVTTLDQLLKNVFDQRNGKTLEDAQAYILNNNGILYGSTATQENVDAIKNVITTNSRKVNRVYLISVWYVEETPKAEVKTYDNLIVDYPKEVSLKETSEGVNVKADLESHVITVEITEKAAASVHVNLIDALAEISQQIVKENGYNQLEPGDSGTYTIKIVDNSGHGYTLKDGSTEFKIIDPENPANKGSIPWRVMNGALAELNIEKYFKYWDNDETGCSKAIGEALRAAGYGAENQDAVEITNEYLDDYYMNYLNSVNETEYASFTEFTSKQLSVLTQDNYKYWELEKETNPAVQSLLYYMMYQNVLTLNKEGMYSLQNDASSIEAGLKDALNGSTYNLLMNIDGELANNAYQLTKWGMAIQFDLEYTPEPEEPEQPEPEEPKTPETPEEPDTPEKPEEPEVIEEEPEIIQTSVTTVQPSGVQTGTETNTPLLSSLAGISLAGAFLLKKKKDQE